MFAGSCRWPWERGAQNGRAFQADAPHQVQLQPALLSLHTRRTQELEGQQSQWEVGREPVVKENRREEKGE